MKFARYLDDTQTPEWKRAYIDYRGLKAQLKTIRTHTVPQGDPSCTVGHPDIDHIDRSAPVTEDKSDDARVITGQHLHGGTTTSARVSGPSVPAAGPLALASTADPSGHEPASPLRRRTSYQAKPSLCMALTISPGVTGTSSATPSQQTPPPPKTPRSAQLFPFFRDPAGTPTPPPLHTILANLPATHSKFFRMLDTELEKVESFHAEREKEMNERAKRLKEQLNELGVHHQMFNSKTYDRVGKSKVSVSSAMSSLVRWLLTGNVAPEESEQTGASGMLASESGRNGRRDAVDISDLGSHAIDHTRRAGGLGRSPGRAGRTTSEEQQGPDISVISNAASSPGPLDDSAGSPPRSSSLTRPFDGQRHPLDHHGYRHAKRRLRKAAVEHYRGLEVLNNYRILNLIGFRKALKKYERITKNSVLDAYMNEKVEPLALASGASVSTLIKEMEDLFAMRFERGDRKKALDRLRVGPFVKTHHFSTFRSGLWLGLALPAIIGAFREYTRGLLPTSNVLLFIYSIFLLPVLMTLLIGVDIAIWARERINYVFIFDLNSRSRLDHHEYFELPSLLFCTLAHAFWFSLAQIGPPLLWPLIWLALTLIVMFNPFRSLMWGPARWWTIKNIAKLVASGIWKVEFTDFWLGDQFCSLSYSLSGTYFVGCFYSRLFSKFALSTVLTAEPSPVQGSYLPSSPYGSYAEEAWSTCGTPRNWGWYYVLSVLPFAVRFVQSLRRYRDSNLPTHLINAGKYGMGMIQYFFYYYWRHQELPHVGVSYVLWCFTGVVYATYACTWDFLMDWSLCKPHAQYPLLRPELVYKSQIPSYYFALVSNICIRFLWLIYIPANGPSMTVRTFIVAMLEVLRRVQWNLYRLENEHLGNIDQYRVTREVPLPYHFDTHSNEEEEEHEEEAPASPPPRSWLKRRIVRLGRNQGHG